MLYVRYENLLPDGFKGKWSTSKHTHGVRGFRFIPFDLNLFLDKKEWDLLIKWCESKDYELRPAFYIFPVSHEEYWSIILKYSGSSVNLELKNKSFSKLIMEIKKFIKMCC